jgi:hypothetical protein
MEQRRLVDQRLNTLNAAEVAITKVTAEYRVADFEQRKAAFWLERADECFEISCGTHAPDDSSWIGYGQIPMSWSTMNDKLYTEVKASVGDTEYQQSNGRRQAIKRFCQLQNFLLWGLFDLTLWIVSETELNNGNAIKEYLWHGSKVRVAHKKMLAGGIDIALAARCQMHQPPRHLALNNHTK